MRFPFPPAESEAASSATPVPEESQPQEPFVVAAPSSAERTAPAEIVIAEMVDLAPEPTVAKSEVSPTGPVPPPAADLARPELPSATEPQAAPLPRPKAQRKVIAFPRLAAGTPCTPHRLADPVLPEQPRILDVPEELEAFPTTPFLDGLQFGPNPQPAVATHADNVGLPFRAAGRAHRSYAALLDGGIVVVASAIFVAVGYKMLPGLIVTRPLLLATAALSALLWAVYQYLLLVYGGATAGMRIAKIHLSTFKGKAPRRRERRQRVLALYFSAASFVMGLLWAFVDVDALCWHDRISRTYLTERE